MVPVSYNYRSLIVRWKTTLMTASGFTLVVGALIVMLAFINGIQEVCATSGEPENVVVLSKGAGDEILSQMDRGVISQLESTRGFAGPEGGRPLVSRELFVIANRFLTKNDYAVLAVRGVVPAAFDVHSKVRFESGRRFRPGASEVVIGKGVAQSNQLKIGDSFTIGRKQWRVVGVFSAAGSALESEIWCDLSELASQFKREGLYTSVCMRAANPDEAVRLANSLTKSRRMNVEAQTETNYYAKQAEQTKFLESAAWVIAWFMGVGAIFGVMNTMYAAINQRIKDIAVMRIMGFQPREILLSFLTESILIAIVGGLLGAGVGYLVNGITQNTDIGARQVQFAFRVDLPTLLLAGTFSIVMGVAGGLFPALSAMRIKPIEALR
ncbi:MAG: ABC transporter permease [Pirellulales bacterium]|jgi:putative ABC transport system permease protein|nr:ABC transporter permease [Pirellulales bacterium]